MITTSSDPVYLVDPSNGEIVWRTALGAGTLAAPAAQTDGWFYCFSNYGILYSFEVRKDLRFMKGPEKVTLPSAIYKVAHVSSTISS